MAKKKKKGTEEADSFVGGNKNDNYSGLDGHDTIVGNGGNDKLFGDEGNDGIMGGDGKDKIKGGAGFDIITGDGGKDTLWGGTETDSFIFRTGGKFGIGSDVDIIKDVDTEGVDIDHIQILSVDPGNLIDSFNDVLKHARQDGKDVELNFGHGDILILANTKKSELSAELFMFEG